jgi:hypothetical protein
MRQVIRDVLEAGAGNPSWHAVLVATAAAAEFVVPDAQRLALSKVAKGGCGRGPPGGLSTNSGGSGRGEAGPGRAFGAAVAASETATLPLERQTADALAVAAAARERHRPLRWKPLQGGQLECPITLQAWCTDCPWAYRQSMPPSWWLLTRSISSWSWRNQRRSWLMGSSGWLTARAFAEWAAAKGVDRHRRRPPSGPIILD